MKHLINFWLPTILVAAIFTGFGYTLFSLIRGQL